MIKFTDLLSTDLDAATRNGNDLDLLFNSGDSLKLAQLHYLGGRPEYQIDQIVFADGMTWQRNDIMALPELPG
ncbi:MAG: hypothetical protein LBE78_10935 [Burkholderiaceae bacterium]|nr:hypothetical protein [Burkholderiaceae bacterium]